MQGGSVEGLPAEVEAERIVSAATTAVTATHLYIAFTRSVTPLSFSGFLGAASGRLGQCAGMSPERVC